MKRQGLSCWTLHSNGDLDKNKLVNSYGDIPVKTKKNSELEECLVGMLGFCFCFVLFFKIGQPGRAFKEVIQRE